MRLAHLTASTAALLLSSTALLAQESSTTYENVFLDVGGTPLQVPVALAAEACGLDEAGVQQAALSRIEGSGLDDVAVQELFAATAPASAMDSTGAADTAAADTTGTTGAAGTETTTADAANTPAPGSEPASTGDTDIAAAETPAPGSEPAEAGTTDTAAADTGSGEMTGVLEEAETTAADATAIPDSTTTAAQGMDSDAQNQQMLDLAVCQIDVTRASELGITGVGDATTTDAETSGG